MRDLEKSSGLHEENQHGFDESHEATQAASGRSSRWVTSRLITKHNVCHCLTIVLSVVVSLAIAIMSYEALHDYLLRQTGYLFVAEPQTVEVEGHDGETVNVHVNVRSITNKNVRVVGVSASCTCLVPENQFPFELQPGESHTLNFRVRLNPLSRAHNRFIGEAQFFIEALSPPVIIKFIRS